MIKFNFSFKTMILALVGVVCLGVNEVKAGTKYAELIVNGSVVQEYNTDNVSTKQLIEDAWKDALKYSGSTKATIKLYNNDDDAVFVDIDGTNATGTVTELTLDLNSCAVSMNGAKGNGHGWFIRVNKSGFKLIVKDSGTGGFVQVKRTRDDGYLMGVRIDAGSVEWQSGLLEVENQTTDASRQAYGVYVVTAGSFTMQGGTIKATKPNSADARGIQQHVGTTVVLNGGEVYTKATATAYCVYVNDGTCTINNGTFTSHATTGNNARTVLIQNSGNVTINNGTIISKSATTGNNFCINTQHTSVCTVNGGCFKTDRDYLVYKGGGTVALQGGYYSEFSGTTGKTQISASGILASGYKVVDLNSDDVMYSHTNAYRYQIIPSSAEYEAKVKTSASGSNYYYYTSFTGAFAYAQTQSGATTYLLRNITYSGDSYLNYNPASAISNTLNLQTFKITGTNTADRLLNVANGTLTVTGTTGGLSFSRNTNSAIYGAYVNAGARLDITGGALSCSNTNTGASANANACYVTGANSKIYISGSPSITASTSSSSAISCAVHTNGKTSISETPTFTAQKGLIAGDVTSGYSSGYNEIEVIISGGTFSCTGTVIESLQTGSGTKVYGNISIEGGMFSSSLATPFLKKEGQYAYLKLKGGHYNETSGTTHKDQLLTYCYDGKAVFSSSTPGYSWEVKNGCLITLDKGTSGNTDGYAIVTENSTSLTEFSAPTRTGYHPTGYWTAKSGGTKVINANQTLVSNVLGYTNADGQWTKTSACVLYAQWEENPKCFHIDRGNGVYDNKASFREALSYATAGTNVTITLTDDYTETADEAAEESLPYNSGSVTSCTLNLNGHSLTMYSKAIPFRINGASSTFKFTVTNASSTGGFYNTYSGSTRSYGVQVNGGELILQGKAKISCVNTAGPAEGVWVSASGATATIKGEAKVIAKGYLDSGGQREVAVKNTGGIVNIMESAYLEAQLGTGATTRQDASRALMSEGTNATFNVYGGTIKSAQTCIQYNGTTPTFNISGGCFDASTYMLNGAVTTTWNISGGYYKYTTNGKLAQATHIASGYTLVDMQTTSPYKDDDVMYKSNGYRYTVVPSAGCEAKVKTSSETYWHYYHTFVNAFADANTQANATTMLLRDVTYSAAAYINYNPSTAIANTLDLNGCDLIGGNSGNRLLNLSKGTFTIKDSGSGGTLSFSKSGAYYGVVVNAGTTLNVQSGTVYCENTDGWARGIHADKGTINISGSGKVDAQGTTEATAIFANYSAGAGAVANISGNAVISATSKNSNAPTYTIRMLNSTVTVTGGTVNAKANTLNSYCFRVDGASSVLNISGGTFNIDSDDRTNGYNCGIITYGGTTTISGGTFKNYCTGSNCAGIRALAGTVTINGTNNPFFDSKVGILAADAAPASDVTTQVIVNVNGGTFKCTNLVIDANQNPQAAYWASKTTRVYSTVAVTGGKFYTTLGTPCLREMANSSLTLTGGYYNETSGTVHKDQLENLTEDPYHPVELTSAEKSSVDGDGMTFKYKIAEAYTLTFDVNTAGYGTVSPTSIENIPVGTTPTVSSNTVTVYGTTVTATPTTATAQYSYAFNGWSNATAAVTADRTITANFTRTTRTYNIVWKNEDGSSTLETDASQAYGATTAYNGATPTKAATAQYTYTFDGWATTAGGPKVYNNGETPTVSGAATYYAHFSATLRNYTVTVERNNNAYGTVDKASVTNVPYGSTFSTSGNKFTINGTTVTATPTAATAQYTYAFSSWTNASGTVTGNVTVTANFSCTTNNYTVTVQASPAGYGSVSASSITSVPYGTAVSVSGNKLTINGTTVTATAASTTAQYSYAFSSWSGAPATITGAVTITANFTATPRTYTVTLNTNGGTINAGNVTSYTYGTGATLPTNVTKDGYEFAGWYDNIGLTGSAVTTISTTATGNKEFWAKWTAATITFTGATNSLWSTTTNWSSGVLPTAEHDVIIQKPCSVNVQNAKAKSIAIYNNGSDKTGQLIIGPNQALEVTGAITKTTNGSNRIATTPSDLILQSAAAGNASLVFDNTDNTKYTQATVETYSKATYPVGGTATWQYIGVPFAGGIDAISNYYETWLYEWAYNGEKWTWMAKSPGDIVNPWYGYCITQRTAGNVSPQGTLCPTATIDLNFESSVGAGQNMVFANSWTAPIQITQMTVSDFVNVDPTIYFFNTGLDEQGTGGSGTAPGTYRTVPIASAASIGVTKISSAQGFYVKSSNTNAKVQLSYTKHVRPNGGNSIVNGPMYAPKRHQAENPDVMKIVAQGSRYGTDLYLLSREDFSMGYDAGWDGENINEAGAGPLMYTLREDGTKDAISAVPEYEGTVVGFHAGEDSEYTFSFTYNGDEVWYLNDLLTETSTLISAETTYTFATTGKDDTRFVISATPLAKTPQGIESIQDSEVSVQKELINDQLYIKVGTRTYDATGKLVENK